MRRNANLEALLAPGAWPVRAAELPAELEACLQAGWRRDSNGALLLGGAVAGRRVTRVPPGEIGGYEYRNNKITIPNDDLALEVKAFAQRLAGSGPLLDEADIDYRRSDGSLPPDISRYLAASTERALIFARRALIRAHEQIPDDGRSLIAIVNTGIAGDVLLSGTTVRFTTGRGEPSGWFDIRWYEDLNRFAMDAIAVLDASDV